MYQSCSDIHNSGGLQEQNQAFHEIYPLEQGYTTEQSSWALSTAPMIASTLHVNTDLVPVLSERGSSVQGDCQGCNQKRLRTGTKDRRNLREIYVPGCIRHARRTEQGDLIGDLVFSATEDIH